MKRHTIRELVRGELEYQELSIRQVAKLAKLDDSTLARWLRGGQLLTDTKLEALFGVLKIQLVPLRAKRKGQ